MAKQFIDDAITDDKVDMTKTDGTALTLTNSALYTLLTRVRDKIAEVEQ